MDSRGPIYDLTRTPQPCTVQSNKDDTKSTGNREIAPPADSGYGGHERANEESDRKDREAYPTLPQKSAYRSLIGPTPKCGPDDRAKALEYLSRIETAIDIGGWTRNESKRLRGLAMTWQARVNGIDIRYRVMGNRNGGMTYEEHKAYLAYKAINSISLIGGKG